MPAGSVAENCGRTGFLLVRRTMNPLVYFKRVLIAIPTLLGVGVVVFVLMRVVPGDPIAMMIAPGASPQDIQNLSLIHI